MITRTLCFFMLLMHLFPVGSWAMLWPLGSEQFAWWQLVTHGFVHSGWLHLGLNMLALWTFGRKLEPIYGPVRYLALYLLCMLAAAVGQLLLLGDARPMVGSSGAIFGLLVAYAMCWPNQKILLLIPPIPMRAMPAVGLLAILSAIMAVTGVFPDIGHIAHLCGMIASFLLFAAWRDYLWRKI